MHILNDHFETIGNILIYKTILLEIIFNRYLTLNTLSISTQYYLFTILIIYSYEKCSTYYLGL